MKMKKERRKIRFQKQEEKRGKKNKGSENWIKKRKDEIEKKKEKKKS